MLCHIDSYAHPLVPLLLLAGLFDMKILPPSPMLSPAPGSCTISQPPSNANTTTTTATTVIVATTTTKILPPRRCTTTPSKRCTTQPKTPCFSTVARQRQSTGRPCTIRLLIGIFSTVSMRPWELYSEHIWNNVHTSVNLMLLLSLCNLSLSNYAIIMHDCCV